MANSIYEDSPHREAPNKHTKGSKKYKQMIAEDTKRLDNYGNLPFQFIKPPKSANRRREVLFCCDHCGALASVNRYTCGIVCTTCHKYCSVTAENSWFEDDESTEVGTSQEQL